jgi:hypothetical protein
MLARLLIARPATRPIEPLAGGVAPWWNDCATPSTGPADERTSGEIRIDR